MFRMLRLKYLYRIERVMWVANNNLGVIEINNGKEII